MKHTCCESCKHYKSWSDCIKCNKCPCYGCNCEFPYHDIGYMPNYEEKEEES